jgi:hypothetical protein
LTGEDNVTATATTSAHDQLIDAFARELELRDPSGTWALAIGDPSMLVEQAVARMLAASSLWSAHLGPVYDVAGVMSILGVTKQAVSKRHLLALTTGSGRVVYPAFQFTSSGVVPGLPAVLALVPDSLVSPWTVASWLITPAVELAGSTPIAVLTSGETAAVLDLASRWSGALAA